MGILRSKDAPVIEAKLAPKEEMTYFEVPYITRKESFVDLATALLVEVVESEGAMVVRTDHQWDAYDAKKYPYWKDKYCLTVYAYHTTA